MKKHSISKRVMLGAFILAMAILADKVRICYHEAKTIAANPAREDARQALKSLLEKPLIARPVIERILNLRSIDFSIEFRRRLYRQLYRSRLEDYRQIIIEDFKTNTVARRELFKDGTLISSFPASDDTEYQSALATWLGTASTEELETFYWTIQESPLEHVSSFALIEESRRRVDELLANYAREPERVSDETLVNVGFALEKMAHPGMAIENSRVLAALLPTLDGKDKFIFSSSVPWTKNSNILTYMYSKCTAPLLRAEICGQLVGMNKTFALHHFRSVEKSLPPVDRKTYLCYLVNAGFDLNGFQMDDAFRGDEPRLVMFSIYDVVELPSFREYSSITGKAYLERGKRFPLEISMTENQKKQIIRFAEEYRWHPGLDDAYYRFASCDVQEGNWVAGDQGIFMGLSSTDTDAHPYLKLLLINSLATSNRVLLPSEMADALTKAGLAATPSETMVACNRLALGLPSLIVLGERNLSSKIIKFLTQKHRVGSAMWGMSSLAWENTGDKDNEGWLHSFKRLLDVSGNPRKLIQLIQDDREVKSHAGGLTAGWEDLSLVDGHALDLTRGTLLHHSLLYQLFLARGSLGISGSRELCPVLVDWLESLREVPYTNNEFEGRLKEFKVSGREREVARWLVEMARKQEWTGYSPEDVKLLMSLSRS